MASLAASTAAASLGMSEMLGNPINGATRLTPSHSTTSSFKVVSLFSKKKAPPPTKQKAVSPANDELAKWYGKFHNNFNVLFSCFNNVIGCLS